MSKLIRAVAIGPTAVDISFDAHHTDVSGVRPYIQGLKDWLNLQPNQKTQPQADGTLGQYILGTHYDIEYKERDTGAIQDAFTGAEQADVLFCMSTFVGAEAIKWRDNHQPPLDNFPIVVITSNPASPPFSNHTQVCGVSALRPQLASVGIGQFKSAQPHLTKIWVLNRKGYGPSEDAKKGVGSAVGSIDVKDIDDPVAEVANKRSHVPGGQMHGLFVLPADRFFGLAAQIQAAADAAGNPGSSMPTFWSTTDWPPNSFGGYGFPQRVCGRYMAERVASIWGSDSGKVPDPAFITIDPSEIRLKRPLARRVAHRRRSKRSARKKRY